MFKKKGGQKFMNFDDAQKYSGMDPDYSKKEMWNQIENGASSGEFPECTDTSPPHSCTQLTVTRDRIRPVHDCSGG